MIHNETASIVALARNVRDGLDMTREHTQVRTPTLALLLDLLIDLGAQPTAPKRNEELARAIRDQTMSIAKVRESAEKVFESEAAFMESRFNGGS
jgi:hypothetical protein